MMQKRFSFGLLLSLGALSLSASGCEVSTCTGSSCFDDDDAGADGSGDGTADGNADGTSDGSDGSSDVDGGVDAGGGGDGGGDGGDDGGITKTQFCERQLAPGLAWAELTDKCCLNETDTASVERLLGVVGYQSGVGACESQVDSLLATGNITYHGEYAGACADAFASQYAPPESDDCPAAGFRLPDIEASVGHGAQVLAQIPDCRAAFAGSLGVGDFCANTFQCADGNVCKAAPGEQKACTPYPAGDTLVECVSDGDCKLGTTCAGRGDSKVCIKITELLAENSPCQSSTECADTLWCNVKPSGGGEPSCGAPSTCDDTGDVRCTALCVP